MGNDLIQIGTVPPQGGVGVEVLSAAEFASAPAGDGKTFYIETFGCQMNVHDSEKVAGVLMARGYCPVDSHQDADIILYNTCSIREKAAQKVFSRLGTFRKAGLAAGKIIGVLGCVASVFLSARRRSAWCAARRVMRNCRICSLNSSPETAG
jgi:tRNA-2-methylthio-N6-dimethylallyladenosine synthase